MDARVLLSVAAALSAFACAFAALFACALEVRSRKSAMVAQGSDAGLVEVMAWRVRNGYSWAKRPAATIMRIERIGRLADDFVAECSVRGVATTRESAASVILVWLLAAGLAVGLATFSAIAALAVSLCLAAALSVVLNNARDKRWEKARDSVPAALESMASCFGAGFTLLQTFKQIADEVPGPLGDTFSRSVHVLETGGSSERALAELRTGEYASELAFIAVALDVQHRSGGAMRQVLDAATETVKDELALRRSLTVQTAQAKLSARVVSIMPFILIAAFSLASPDFLMPFFSSPQGYALLALALVMQVAGIVLVRRALAVDGVA